MILNVLCNSPCVGKHVKLIRKNSCTRSLKNVMAVGSLNADYGYTLKHMIVTYRSLVRIKVLFKQPPRLLQMRQKWGGVWGWER